MDSARRHSPMRPTRRETGDPGITEQTTAPSTASVGYTGGRRGGAPRSAAQRRSGGDRLHLGRAYNPGGGGTYTYQVRAVASASCYTDSTGQAFTDQAFPMSFAGIATATDVDACDDTGVVVTWSLPASWNDGDFGTRGFRVFRDGGVVSGLLGDTVTSFVDTGGANGVSYDYSVVAVNGYGWCGWRSRASSLPWMWREQPRASRVSIHSPPCQATSAGSGWSGIQPRPTA